MNNYVYTIGNKLYINLTNRCSNRCEFCIRRGRDGMEGQNLWLESEPTAEEVIAALPENLDEYDEEVVFCGFGEPTYNLEALEEVASFLHCVDKKTRINTNGHANLINKKDVADVIVDSCDVINVSLNASTAEKYNALCHSIFENAFEAMTEFAKECLSLGGNVVMSVVDSVGKAEIEACRKVAKDIGATFRVREKV